MSFDRLDIPTRITNIQEYASRHGAALALHPSFYREEMYDQADRLDNAVDVVLEHAEERYAAQTGGFYCAGVA